MLALHLDASAGAIVTSPRDPPDRRRGRYARCRLTGVDWIIVGLVLLLALFGWAQGFISGVLAFAGLALGAWIGTRIGPLILSEGEQSPWAPAFGLLGALLVGGGARRAVRGVRRAGAARAARDPGFGAARRRSSARS